MKNVILVFALLFAATTTTTAQFWLAEPDTTTPAPVALPVQTTVTTNAEAIEVEWHCNGQIYSARQIVTQATIDTVPAKTPCPSFSTAVYGDGQSDKGIVNVFYNSQNSFLTFGEPCELGSDKVIEAYEVEADGSLVRYLRTATHMITISFKGDRVALRCEDTAGNITAVLHN